MVTPFGADGSLDLDLAARLAVHLSATGSDGIVVCGTTGESPTLSWEEEQKLIRAVKSAVGDRAQVIAGTGSNSTREAIAATQAAARLGVDATMQVVPYYNKPPQAGLYEHFRAIASSAPELPVLLYNVPGRTGQSLEAETIAKLAAIPNIVAVKEASGQLDRVSQIRCLTPPEFAIYSGDDNLTLPMLAVGGCGTVSVASHLVGKDIQQMIRDFSEGNVRAALDTHVRLFPLFKALFLATNPIPIKTALQLQGWSVGGFRSPLCELAPELKSKLEATLQNLGLL